jgi:hypothetical protein
MGLRIASTDLMRSVRPTVIAGELNETNADTTTT